MSAGGNLLVLGTEGKQTSNINYLLEEYGISFVEDCVCRSTFHKYHHPKQALINDGCHVKPSDKLKQLDANSSLINITPFVYPYGSSLLVQKPASILFSTGSTSIPLQRPVGAVCVPTTQSGAVVCLGSELLFHDDYFDKESNSKVLEILLSQFRFK